MEEIGVLFVQDGGAYLVEEWCDAETEEARVMKFHTQTAGQSLTAQQPMHNVARVTIQALAAVSRVHRACTPTATALALPSEDAVRVSLRTRRLIAEEPEAADIVDPLGGSFAVESLTDEVEQEAMEYIEGGSGRTGGRCAPASSTASRRTSNRRS
jgi:methylmalonyl-CoA mutase N-terminal domain/subunit